MKTLIIQTTGETLTLTTEDTHNLGLGMTAQEPNWPLRIPEDDSVVWLNCRQVVAWSEEDAGEEPAAAEPTPEPEQKMIPDADPASDPDRTVAQLKDALDAAEVEYPSGAVKAELQTLAREHNV